MVKPSTFPVRLSLGGIGSEARSLAAFGGFRTKQRSLWAPLGDKEKHTRTSQAGSLIIRRQFR